jgi:hypothetical protein
MRYDIRKFLLLSSALTGTMALSHHADASSLTLTNNYGYTGTGSTITGAFDLSGFISQEAVAGNNVTINSGTVQIYGYSQANNTYTSVYAGSFLAGYYTYTVPYYYSYGCGWSTCYGVGYYTVNSPYYGSIYNVTQGDNQKDVVLADFGDQQLSGTTQQPATNSYVGYSTTRYNITTGNSFGDISAAAGLSTFSLSELINLSMLNYTLDVTDGQFNTLEIQLALDYTSTPQSNQVATPIPPAFLLFGTGLGALAFSQFGRRRKKKSEPQGQ